MLHDPVTWHKISHARVQVTRRTSNTKQLIPVQLDSPLFWKSHCVVCVPGRADSLPADWAMKRTYSRGKNICFYFDIFNNDLMEEKSEVYYKLEEFEIISSLTPPYVFSSENPSLRLATYSLLVSRLQSFCSLELRVCNVKFLSL